MRELTRAALAVATILVAVVLLSGAFRLLAGIEITPLEEGVPLPEEITPLEREPLPGRGGMPDFEVPVDGIPPHTPLFEIVGAPNEWFVRERVGEIYGDGFWRMSENSLIVDYGGEDIVPDVKEYSSSVDWRTTIVPIALMRGFIPAPSYAIRVENLDNLKYLPLQHSFFTGFSFGSTYSVSYKIFEYNEELLRGAKLDLDPVYLQLPAEVTGRTKQLALGITQGIENPYEKAKAIESYLRTSYEYDKNYTRAPAGWDPVDWFLFEERRGHCMNFNSAFVVLARSVNIPARAVFGYAVDPDAEHQVVYADDGHVNAEVKFEKLGLVPFNATAPHPENVVSPAPRIPTRTEVTEVDATGVKGGTFRVKGRVVDENGVGVGGVRVMVYLKKDKTENAPPCGSGVTENGGFAITCEVSKDVEVGDYHVVAHSLGNQTYGESWSDPKIKIVSGTSLSLSGPNRVLTGMEFSIGGRLAENVTGKGVGSQKVKVRLGTSVREEPTDGSGNFEADFSLPEADNYTVSASFGGSIYYLASSCEYAVEAVPPDVVPTTSENLLRGEKARLSGVVPVENIAVRIYLDNELVAETVSGTGGAFGAENLIPSSRPLGRAVVSYTLPDVTFSESQDVLVCARTFVGYDAPGEAEPGKVIEIAGNLRDDLGTPLPDVWLKLRYAGGELQAKTDNAGVASFEFTVPSELKENLEFTLSFEGSGFYLPSENAVSLALAGWPPPSEAADWGWLGVALPAVGGAIAAALLLRKKRKARAKAKPTAAERAPVRGLGLEVGFPEIKEPFPDVWGVGDPLRISFRLTREGKPVGGAALRVKIDGEEREVRTPASGGWSEEHKFEKGTHKVAVEYAEGKAKLRAEREVRIVNYREEIVGIFNSLLGSFRERGIDAEGDFTPREVQRGAEAKIEGLDRKALDELVGIFEVANYSLREVGRREYERAYLSSQSVLRSAGGQA